jgi:DNA-binding MarR family transcriptional regulator
MSRSSLDPSHRILEQVASGARVSQRSLARESGIALGLANLLIHRMVQQGWVQMVPDGGNRVRYRLTRAGLAERARRSREHFAGGIRYYVQARERIAERLMTLSRDARFSNPSDKRIAFFGAGEVAEIAYVCLRRTDLRLVGVVDHAAGTRFFDFIVRDLGELSHGQLAGQPFDVLAVMSFSDRKNVRRALARAGITPSALFWL